VVQRQRARKIEVETWRAQRNWTALETWLRTMRKPNLCAATMKTHCGKQQVEETQTTWMWTRARSVMREQMGNAREGCA
jgi:hypothetical protein